MSTSDLHDNISQQRRWSGRRKQRQWVMGIICDNTAHHTRAEEIQSKLKVSGLTGDNSSCWSANTSLGVHCCPKCEEKTWHWKYDIWALSLCHSLTHTQTSQSCQWQGRLTQRIPWCWSHQWPVAPGWHRFCSRSDWLRKNQEVKIS